jgi:hypothetical protein
MPIGDYGKQRFLDEYLDELDKKNRSVHDINSALSFGTAVVGLPNKLAQLANYGGLPSALSSVGKVASTVGTGLNVIGGATSAISLGKDIYDAVKNKHVGFDDAMKISDDATGVASAIGSAINPLLGLGITLGEKIVTGAIKADKAVKEEKKRQGVEHLKTQDWFDTVWTANTSDWMNQDIGELVKEHKKNKPTKAAKKQAKKDYKQYKKDVWKHGTGKEKAHLFFFG